MLCQNSTHPSNGVLSSYLVLFPFYLLLTATYTVTNTNSSGAGSLAQAISDANLNPGPDVIVFNIPVNQPCIINLSGALPSIDESLTIDGYSQPGSLKGTFATRVIRININAAGSGGNGLVVNADSVVIEGLAIYGAPGYGIKVPPVGVDKLHIWGNYIGTDSTGTATGLGNVGGGIEVNITSSIVPSDSIIIGTDGDGDNDANEGNLITSSSSGTGNNGDGILFWLCTHSRIAGNIIGLNKDGIGTGMGHSRDGIVVTVDCTNVFIGTNRDGVSDNLETNLIGNNGRNGILLGGRSNNNVIAGNTIGLNAADAAAGNGAYGILLSNAFDNEIGTDANGTSDLVERNIIGSNGSAGLRICNEFLFGFESNSNGNEVKGNIIGANAALTVSHPNGSNGIELQAAFSPFTVNDNVIGTNYDGTNDDAERNIILNNTTNGIQVLAPAAGTAITGNKFSGNLIYNNTLLGIDLQGGTEATGVTLNDQDDVDAGANDLLNAPVITAVRIDGSDLVLDGFSRPGSIIEFYIPDAALHPTDPLPGGFVKSFGQGQVFLLRAQEGATLNGIADTDATTGAYDGSMEGTGLGGSRTDNKFSFRIALSSLPAPVNPGTRMTALAYLNATGAGSTSEFGGVSAAANLPVHFVSFAGRIREGKAYLRWTTADEQNNDHFEVQKSTTGSDFTTIGHVSPLGGQNNDYTYTDEAAAPGMNYYRLKQVDLDGRFMYSKVLILQAELGRFSVKAGPNPFTGTLNIFYQLDNAELLHMRLYDQGGRVVKQVAVPGGAGANTYLLTGLDNLPRAHYMLELSGKSVQYKQPIVKQ